MKNLLPRKLKNIIKKNKNYKFKKEEMAEQMSFYFMADYPNDNTGWETYYESMKLKNSKKSQLAKLGEYTVAKLWIYKIG